MATETAPLSVPPPGGPAAGTGSTTSERSAAGARAVVDLTRMDDPGGVVLVPDPERVAELLSTFVEVRVPPSPAPAPTPPALVDLVRLVALAVAVVSWPALVLLLPVPGLVAFALVVGGWGLTAALVSGPVVADDPDPPEVR